MKKKILIDGMSCEHCVNHVSTALKGLTDVTKVEVNLADKHAILEAVENLNDDEIKDTIKDAGYEVTKIETL